MKGLSHLRYISCMFSFPHQKALQSEIGNSFDFAGEDEELYLYYEQHAKH